MRSYGVSVHMDPDSAESKAKRAQYKAENEQWEREWAGVDEEVDKAREELRKENMRTRRKENIRTRITRDIIDMMAGGTDPEFEDLVGRVVSKGMDELDAGDARGCGDNKFEEAPSTCNPADTFDAFSYEYAKASATGSKPRSDDAKASATGSKPRSDDAKASATGSKPRSDDGYGHFTARASPPPASSSTNSTSNFSAGRHSSTGYLPPERFRFYAGHYPGSSSTSSTSSSSSAHSHIPCPTFSSPYENCPETLRLFCKNISSVTKDVKAAVQNPMVSLNVDPKSIRPLLPYFNHKLADPQGRYTMRDYQSELHGIMLEMYCGWLEELRLSIPGALPVPAVRVERSVCRHLGLWQKEFCRPKCQACEAWRPLFTLTCPGCKYEACVRCKYQVGLRAHLSTGF
jgi:hypothetical protein